MYIGHRYNLYKDTTPGEHFEILKRFITDESQSKSESKGFVFTSNVDGQFQKAGFPGDCIVECHGSIHYLQSVDGYGDIVKAQSYIDARNSNNNNNNNNNSNNQDIVYIDPTTFRAQEPLPG